MEALLAYFKVPSRHFPGETGAGGSNACQYSPSVGSSMNFGRRTSGDNLGYSQELKKTKHFSPVTLELGFLAFLYNR